MSVDPLTDSPLCRCGHRHGAHIGDDWGDCIECERPRRCRFYAELTWDDIEWNLGVGRWGQ